MNIKQFTLCSPGFKHSEDIPAKYTAHGKNINPPLHWDGAPYDTQSYALIVDDPDAPNGVWTHWLVKNIPKETTSIKEDSIPGEEVENSWSQKGWGGPDPPFGKHRYFFRLFAINSPQLDASDLHHFYKQVERQKLGEAILMGKFSKV